MAVYDIEYTDTFGREANYSWVKKAEIVIDDKRYASDKSHDRELVRRAKAEMGLTGCRGTVENCGDGITFRPFGYSTVMFINARA